MKIQQTPSAAEIVKVVWGDPDRITSGPLMRFAMRLLREAPREDGLRFNATVVKKELASLGYDEHQVGQIREAVASAWGAVTERLEKAGKVPANYIDSHAGNFGVYGLYLNVGDDTRVKANEDARKLAEMKLEKLDLTPAVRSTPTAAELHDRASFHPQGPTTGRTP